MNELEKIIKFVDEEFSDGRINWSIDEDIELMKNGTIITLTTDQFGKPYLYTSSPLKDECVNALKVIKMLKKLTQTTKGNDRK